MEQQSAVQGGVEQHQGALRSWSSEPASRAHRCGTSTRIPSTVHDLVVQHQSFVVDHAGLDATGASVETCHVDHVIESTPHTSIRCATHPDVWLSATASPSESRTARHIIR